MKTKPKTNGTMFRQSQANDEKLTRPSDAIERLRNAIDEMKQIDGFPTATDDTLCKLSAPPAYTACPNPFASEVLGLRTDTAATRNAQQPLTDDVTAGKNDPLYFAHFYSTKVPPHAIIPYILHFTQPGEVVFDGFCGTGMTALAAQLCGDPAYVGRHVPGRGQRRALVSDLSPAATFIAAVTNSIGKWSYALDDLQEIVDDVARSQAPILRTRHNGWPRGVSPESERKNTTKAIGPDSGHIEYVVWSDVFACSECATELVFWQLVFRGPGVKPPDVLKCPHCAAEQNVRSMDRVWTTVKDPLLGSTIRQAKQVPVLINYSVGKKRFEKHPDQDDLDALNDWRERAFLPSVPVVEMPDGFNTAQPRLSHGFTHVHHFFTPRNIVLLSLLWKRFSEIEDATVRTAGYYLITGAFQRVCRLNRYMPGHDRHVGPLSGTLYVSQLTAEIPATNYVAERVSDLRRCAAGPDGSGVVVSTQSATDLRNVPESCIDYIFTDPPFGGNLNYSELNILVEAWLGARTNIAHEAIVNSVQKKTLESYTQLMIRAFTEFHRVLKPGRWITVEFHNSQNAVWIAIQEALWQAGFVVADVRTLDKQKGTTKQLSYSSTVKQDLVISAYKPQVPDKRATRLTEGSEEGAWEFVRAHLRQLPVCVEREGRLEVVMERQPHLLFDRMIAFHVQRGIAVPISSAEFYAGLAQRFPQRDDMSFLEDQVAEYDRKRMRNSHVVQLELFVIDEASAIQWLRRKLSDKPQTFQELQPQFMKEVAGWEKHEQPLELLEILRQNFICYDGTGEVPNQIHAYLSSNFKELRNLPKANAGLREKARDRWYVPDPNKAGDLEKLRERALLAEFAEYKASKQRNLKIFRTEAVRAGFKAAYDRQDYKTIVEVARKLPENVLQVDEKLLMYYDVARMRLGDAEKDKLFQ